ncbi:MAG TPA: FMN-binding protein [Kiritimatiellia bacterium]|nr:FMN-binding protein [Kiritimatiellia bacterium]
MNKKSPAYVLAFMAAICLVFGTGISVVNYATQGLLAKNAAMHRNRVLCRAFQLDVAGASAEAYQQAVDAALRATTAGGRAVYECVAPGKEGVGFVAGGMGFWDRIDVVVVLSPDLQNVLNVQVLEQKETPGLGARIEEPWFTDQFKGLSVAWEAPPERRVLVGANPAPNAANEVDAITGATQTSMALMRFLNDELAAFRAAYSLSPQPLNPEP